MEQNLWAPEEPPGNIGETLSIEHIFEKILTEMAAIMPKMATHEEERQLFELLRDVSAQSGSGLKPRDEAYIRKKRENFIIIFDEKTLVACGELIELDYQTIELGAVATRVDYQWQGMSEKILEFAEKRISQQWKNIIIVTDNPTLIRRLEKRKYSEVTVLYPKRSKQSPGKKIYTLFL